MNKQLEMVQDFHKAFNYPRQLGGLSASQIAARMSFIMEEFSELLSAVSEEDSVEMLDAAIDLDYFALGTLDMIGADLDEDEHEAADHNLPVALMVLMDCVFLKKGDHLSSALSLVHWAAVQEAERLNADYEKAFAEVQRSNMSKLDKDGKPVYREDGKIIKNYEGNTFSEPNLSGCFKEAA